VKLRLTAIGGSQLLITQVQLLKQILIYGLMRRKSEREKAGGQCIGTSFLITNKGLKWLRMLKMK
jgi:hypothetical protein